MGGNLDLEQLKQEVARRAIDTVLVCFTDMQGRLIGKRVTGHYFLDQVVHEMHACDYLLALDMDMEPVPGYAAASWDKGYGDFAIRPDLATLRRIPWLEGTALVLGDVVDHHGEDVPHSPRAILKRQLARARAAGFAVNMASELEFYVFDEPYGSARKKGYKGLETAGWYIEDYHIFQTTKEEGLIRKIRNDMDAAGIPVEFSKGEWGPGQAELNLKYAEALEMADRHAIYKNGVKEIAFLQGKRRDLHGEVGLSASPAAAATSTSRWSMRTTARRRSPTGPATIRRSSRSSWPGSWRSRATSRCSSRPTSTPTSASRPAPSRRPRRSGAATTARPASAWSAPGPRSGSSAGSRAPMPTPTSPSRRCSRPGLHGIEQQLELEPAFDGRRLQGQGHPGDPEDAARGDRLLSSARSRCAPRSATRWSSTICTPRAGSSSSTTAGSPTTS